MKRERVIQLISMRQLYLIHLKRLNELEVKYELVRNDWHHRLSQIKAIYSTENVVAHYRLRNRSYRAAVDTGFDRGTGIFWIKQGKENGFYETVAEQLIFKPGSPRIYFLALKETLEIKIEDPSYGQLGINASDSGNQDDYFDKLTDGGQEDESEPGEVIAGHAPFTPDPSLNKPSPQPLTSKIASNQNLQTQRSTERDQNTGTERRGPDPKLEIKHKEELKEQHYAYHCQICLCQNSPEKLAPSGSYVEWVEIRRHVMEAHHVDSVSAGGARHAGNMILLCKLHHNNYGRRLTRAAVTATLRNEGKEKFITFGIGHNDNVEVKGCIIKIKIPDTSDEVELFFTDEHSKWWLDNAHPVES